MEISDYKITQWIAQRIKDEHKKHSANIEDWYLLAAKKIVSTYCITILNPNKETNIHAEGMDWNVKEKADELVNNCFNVNPKYKIVSGEKDYSEAVKYAMIAWNEVFDELIPYSDYMKFWLTVKTYINENYTDKTK